jgi:hypothetical protein
MMNWWNGLDPQTRRVSLICATLLLLCAMYWGLDLSWAPGWLMGW